MPYPNPPGAEKHQEVLPGRAYAIAQGCLGRFQNCNNFRAKYYRSIDSVRDKIAQLHFFGGRPIGEKAAATMEMSAPTKLPFSVLGEFAQSSATQPTSPEANSESVAVPIGVLEVPIGVWGSRRVESDSGQSERVEVFAEDTCTVIVFPQGAVIRLSAGAAPGQLVVIANRKSGQIMLCRIVNVRTYPNIKGYAEIEFMHSATNFWGAYASQGILRLAAKVESAMPSASADFWSNGFLEEVGSVPFGGVTASLVVPAVPAVRIEEEPTANYPIQIPFHEEPVQHMAAMGMDSETRLDASRRSGSSQHIVLAPTLSARASSPETSSPRASSAPASGPRTSEESSARFRIGSWIFSWGRLPTARTVTNGTPSPKRNLVLVSLVPALVLLGVLGFFFLRDGVGQPAGISQTAPMPEVSLGSPIANVVQSPQPKSNPTFVVPQLPIAKSDNFPGTQTRDFADNIRPSRPSERRSTSPRSSTSGKKITKEKLLTPYSSANRLAVMGRDAAPDVTGVDSNTGIGPLQGVLGTQQPGGGRAKEPELLVSSAPIYPAMARQARVEGQVTIDAVIDATGKLTNMAVISGPPLLQQAAIDSLRTWKYRPGYLNEKPVSTKTSITVNFRLR
ncbi:MAG TPA: energy transducer TonB [Chthoniobacterales bacterium]|jgi:TonB family protein